MTMPMNEARIYAEAKYTTEHGDIWITGDYSPDGPYGATLAFRGLHEPIATASDEAKKRGYTISVASGKGNRFERRPDGTPSYVIDHLAYAVLVRKPGQMMPIDRDRTPNLLNDCGIVEGTDGG